MNNPNHPDWTLTEERPAQPPERKKRRVFWWVFLAIQLLFLAWVMAGCASSAGTPTDCESLDPATCNDVESVGTAIGVGVVIALWVAVDVIVGATYAVYRFTRRER
ncbi:hypothetical protein ACGFX4_24110 [Kitasatospora sp. NPDC048365]|uniref:hypothetical protein n=1 Tax=Kitasatospora sp. NPDC048365 TaxID=3364050 RepID=UPI0037245F2F